MTTEEITIRVNPKTAAAYREASEQERHKIQFLIGLRLRPIHSRGLSLLEIQSEMSQRAEERGLTPEILQEILDHPLHSKLI